MNLRQIREFRSTLRQFERLNSLKLESCCSGVTLPQCLVLLEVEQSSRTTVGRLASRLRLDDSTLSRTIEGLVRKGLLQRTRDDNDRRVARIRLTSAGTAICRSIHRENDAHWRRVFRKIPSSKHAAVMRNFGILVDAFLACEAHDTEESS